jgi:cytochrome c-type biogenesis protein CcsB
VSPQDLAAFSANAVMSAGIVFVLAMLAHVVEWGTALVAGRSAETEAAATAHSATATAVEAPPDVVRQHRVDLWGRVGVALTVVAAGLHAAGVVTRAFASEPARVPWGNMYEFTLTGSLGVVLIYLALLRRQRLRWMGLFVTTFTVVVLMCANLFLEEAAGPLVPALHSYWLVVHVGAAVLATGAFSVSALASVMFLVKAGRESRDKVRPGSLLDQLPATEALDKMAYRLVAVGFPIWTFAALIAGPIWAEYAWGSYWSWDPKEVWAFITWVGYAAYLHARATAGFRGRAAAIIGLAAFATLLFNFVGINFFFGGGSMHSYAG